MTEPEHLRHRIRECRQALDHLHLCVFSNRLRELIDLRAWETIPTFAPFGSLDALTRTVLSESAASVELVFADALSVALSKATEINLPGAKPATLAFAHYAPKGRRAKAA